MAAVAHARSRRKGSYLACLASVKPCCLANMSIISGVVFPFIYLFLSDPQF